MDTSLESQPDIAVIKSLLRGSFAARTGVGGGGQSRKLTEVPSAIIFIDNSRKI